jgi:deoxycytidine triphosphate deaminase
MSLLSNKAILKEMKEGNVVCEPFNVNHLGTNSIDVTLDEVYFREVNTKKTWKSNELWDIFFKANFFSVVFVYLFLWRDIINGVFCFGLSILMQILYNNYKEKKVKEFAEKKTLFNPFSQNSVEKVWGQPIHAKTLKEFIENGEHLPYNPKNFAGIQPDEKIIIIGPGENLLARTREKIGGKNNVTTMMKARSSFGRSFLEVCSCAGLGDIGYTGKWTCELRNNSPYHHTVLVVGRRIAQIVFFKTDGLINPNIAYQKLSGKYGNDDNPYDMLPKMYLDKESSQY